MKLNKKGSSAWENAGFVILGLVMIVAIGFGGHYALRWANENFEGSQQAFTTINYASGFEFVASWLNVLFGPQSSTWQGLLISLGLLFIVTMAMGDILYAFSTFSKTASWGIGIGMGLIASVAGSVSAIYNLFLAQIALTGLAIFIMILIIIGQAIAVNLIFGNLLGRVRMARKIEEEANKMQYGASVAKNAIRGLGEVGAGFEMIDTQKSKRKP